MGVEKRGEIYEEVLPSFSHLRINLKKHKKKQKKNLGGGGASPPPLFLVAVVVTVPGQ